MIQIFLAGGQAGQPEVVQEVLADLKSTISPTMILRSRIKEVFVEEGQRIGKGTGPALD